ncbi:DUF4126 domain-containing protein [Mesorhizobium sp. LHD-90]|uniref:DUF4126 domain-containing protein n=1 Tax=Mesorhizobium sp. LHD-90 TaxID=3071414 RepID=UPI0027E1E470|nr:DUF4126 domain-containing protein [Mesorhizobium sp. LHD-90]MDQ6433977.1 DUF4126 domain-containing protein [Mesorhizobium sp. LHD-90]
MSIYLAALLIGFVAGLRAMTAPAAVSWGALLGWLPVSESWAAFMGWRFTPWIFSILALVEFVTDQLPSTPSRKVPQQFAARLVSGAFCGAVIGTAGGSMVGGLIAGIVGAVIGTYGGAEARGRLAAAFGQDRPAALIEDAVAIVLGLVAVSVLP